MKILKQCEQVLVNIWIYHCIPLDVLWSAFQLHKLGYDISNLVLASLLLWWVLYYGLLQFVHIPYGLL